MSDIEKERKKERLGALGLALLFTVATIIYLWTWFFDSLDIDKPWVGPLGSLLFGTFCISSWCIYFVKLPARLRARLAPIVTGTGYVLGFAWLILGIMMVFLPLFQQAQHWLQFGEVPSRDMYWLFADALCAETNSQGRGWEGKDICRDTTIFTTGWVGLDRITTFIMDLHTAVVFIVSTTFLAVLAGWFFGQLEQERL